MIAVENRDQVRQIPDTDLRVVLLIEGHEERVELKNPLSDVDDEVAVAPATHRNDAVVAATRPVAVALDDLCQLLEPFCPLEDIFLLVNAAAAAYALLVEGDEEGVVLGVQAPCTVAHHCSKTCFSNQTCPSSLSDFFWILPAVSKVKLL